MPRCRQGPGQIAELCDPLLSPRESIFEPKPPPDSVKLKGTLPI